MNQMEQEKIEKKNTKNGLKLTLKKNTGKFLIYKS